jgi:hypothetical protein
LEEALDRACSHERFDLEKHVEFFRTNKKFQVSNLSEIDKILTSVEYSKFINSVYEYFHSFTNNIEGRLALKHYADTEKIIDQFWRDLFGNRRKINCFNIK